jgi:hypothetical protein
MSLYTFLHNLLNVLAQIANKMGLQEKNKIICNYINMILQNVAGISFPDTLNAV